MACLRQLGWQPGPSLDQEIFLLLVVDLGDRADVAVAGRLSVIEWTVGLDQDSIILLENTEPLGLLDGKDGGDGPIILHHIQEYFPRLDDAVHCDATDSPQS